MAFYLKPSTLDAALAALAMRPEHAPYTPACRRHRLLSRPGDQPARRRHPRSHRPWWIPCLATWTDIVETPLPPLFDGLKQAATQVGGPQIQNVATLAGNVCNASPAADGVPCLLALEATVELASITGTRLLPLQDFLQGPRHTVRQHDEILLGFRIPRVDDAARSSFLKLGGRRYLVISIATVAAVISRDSDDRITRARIAVGACSAIAQRLPDLERALIGTRGDLPAILDDHLAPLSPIGDIRGNRRLSAPRRRRAAPPRHRRLNDPAQPPSTGAPARLHRQLSCLTSAGNHGDHTYTNNRATAMDLSLQSSSSQDLGQIEFILNRRPVQVRTDPMLRLTDLLRDTLGLTGTKIGCNAGDCGACTILLDGRQVCACLTPAARAAGRTLTTVEGLAENARLNALQQAFLRHGAAQCGFCTPGMLMAASDLLARDPAPTERAGARCAERRAVPLHRIQQDHRGGAGRRQLGHPAAVGPAVGSRLAKVDGLAKLTGADRFGADALPDIQPLALRAVRSPHPHARFAFGDFAPVLAAHPGLVRILTAADVPGRNLYGIYPTGKDQPVLAEGLVRHRGEPVCALVGDGETIAAIRDAELPITWDILPPVTFEDADTAPALHPHAPGNILCRGRVTTGDVDAALFDAPVTAGIDITTGFVEHAYIEPEAGYARRVGDRIEIVACTQCPYMDRDEIGPILGIPATDVRVIPTSVGGGFGGKLDLSVQPLTAIAAWLLNRPVRMVYSRRESMAATTKRHPARINAIAGADRTGKLTAFSFHGDFDTGAYASWGPTVANRVPVHAMGPYVVPNVTCTTAAIHTNGPPSGAFRASASRRPPSPAKP